MAIPGLLALAAVGLGRHGSTPAGPLTARLAAARTVRPIACASTPTARLAAARTVKPIACASTETTQRQTSISPPLPRMVRPIACASTETTQRPSISPPLQEHEEQPPLSPHRPLTVLLLVPVAWGTYGVSIKELYALHAPPPELLFAVLNYVVSSSALLAVSTVMKSVGLGSGADAGAGTYSESTAPGESSSARSQLPAPWIPPGLPEGAELGAYLFAGSILQIFGMRYTTATRGAFIVQLTTVIVPLLDSILRRRAPSRLVLAACALAFSGVGLLVTSQATADGSLTLANPLGDGLIGVAAIFYSLHVVRLSALAARVPPIALARAKEVSRLGYALMSLAVGVVFSQDQAQGLQRFVGSLSSDPHAAAIAIAIVAWSGVVTTAFPTWAQSFGQRSVSAAAANVVYTTQPLWSALFGYLLLGETFGPQGSVGAAIILSSLLLVALDTSTAAREQAGSKQSGISSTVADDGVNDDDDRS